MTLPHQKKIIKSSSSATVNELKQSLDYQKVHLKDRIDVVEKNVESKWLLRRLLFNPF